MSKIIIPKWRKRLKEVNWFRSQKEARAWARSLGQKLKPWIEIEPAGFCRKSGWLVRVYEIKEEMRNERDKGNEGEMLSRLEDHS